jgi:hypothetical protein
MAQVSNQPDKPPPEIPKSPPIGTQEERLPKNEFQRNWDQPPISTQGDIYRKLDIEGTFKGLQKQNGEKTK